MNAVDTIALQDERPADSSALRQLALQCYVNGDLVDAHKHFCLALDANPFDADSLADLGALAAQAGAADMALRWSRRALALEPKHDAARYVAACAQRLAGCDAESIAAFRALLDEPDFNRRAPDLAFAAQSELSGLLGQPQFSNGLAVIDPRAVMLGQRLDVIVKYLYAQQRLGLLSSDLGIDAKSLYRQHIHLRTGGQEPGDEARKSSIDDFVAQFEALIDAMASSGFDPAHPVPISAEDGLPLNGAHRIATALAVGCDIAVQTAPGAGGQWNLKWFERLGFSRQERNLLLRTWADLKPDHACVTLLWSPVELAWEEMEARIDTLMPVVDARTLDLSREPFNELVHDIYSYDWGPRTGANIERKVRLLADHPPRVRIVFSERPFDSDAQLPRTMKTELRESFGDCSPVDHFTTLHVSETAGEMRHLMNIFGSENNLRRLRQRTALRPVFVDMLVEMRKLLQQRQIDSADCCVVGSAVLEALGMREADDVDFTLRSALRFAFLDGGVTRLGDRVDVVSFNYPRSFTSLPALTDDELISRPEQHFFVRGVRFADPRIVLTRKQHQRRDKDLRDVELLSRYFDAGN